MFTYSGLHTSYLPNGSSGFKSAFCKTNEPNKNDSVTAIIVRKHFLEIIVTNNAIGSRMTKVSFKKMEDIQIVLANMIGQGCYNSANMGKK